MASNSTQPSDECKRIEALIDTHPLIISLRANPSLRESRFFAGAPDAVRGIFTYRDHFGPGKITVDPVVFLDESCKSLIQIFHLGPKLAGWPGRLHGGLLATMIDESFGLCSPFEMPKRIPITVRLEINYQNPSPPNELYILEAKLVRLEDSTRTGWVEGTLRVLNEKTSLRSENSTHEILVSARAEYKYLSSHL
ncbi:thioesterase family protein [Penicillium vulpinum]|uniref:Thioesterase domain-containing protein n=1 Tax=Penicillium vulpinum TaxID=29845 RepID=A0A1V6S4K8_9EURO|nr:thioesterase family protein [Penicillium vulpinum]KAJ5963428.1 thioesterase family protein [Penicillium vulpinum]OQE08649.1 hypothetical protein PENVUL_c009G10038 [Penicillium vulpinum]